MTKEELAARINGRAEGSELTNEEGGWARDSGLVVVYGYSDDGAELRGAIHDEAGMYGGGEILITQDGKLSPECESDTCPYQAEAQRNAQRITAKWDEGGGALWRYETDIPHTTFDVMSDEDPGDVFCRGIVIDVRSLKPGRTGP